MNLGCEHVNKTVQEILRCPTSSEEVSLFRTCKINFSLDWPEQDK